MRVDWRADAGCSWCVVGGAVASLGVDLRFGPSLRWGKVGASLGVGFTVSTLTGRAPGRAKRVITRGLLTGLEYTGAGIVVGAALPDDVDGGINTGPF